MQRRHGGEAGVEVTGTPGVEPGGTVGGELVVGLPHALLRVGGDAVGAVSVEKRPDGGRNEIAECAQRLVDQRRQVYPAETAPVGHQMIGKRDEKHADEDADVPPVDVGQHGGQPFPHRAHAIDQRLHHLVRPLVKLVEPHRINQGNPHFYVEVQPHDAGENPDVEGAPPQFPAERGYIGALVAPHHQGNGEPKRGQRHRHGVADAEVNADALVWHHERRAQIGRETHRHRRHQEEHRQFGQSE